MTLNYTVRPLSDRTWLRPTGTREASRFDTAWTKTLRDLEREIGMLDGRNVVLGMDVEERHVRVDGKLRAGAKASTPAVEVAFESKHGPLLYRCDRFVKPGYRWRDETSDWQHNVRAIALTLEALRAVDRYSAAQSGEQYRGYRALPAGRGDASSGMTASAAVEVLLRAADFTEQPTVTIAQDRRWWTTHGAVTVRAARARTHPDRNAGDTAQWHLVDNAEQTLRQAGWLPKAVTS